MRLGHTDRSFAVLSPPVPGSGALAAAMGKLQEFDIVFANNKVVYSPGDSMSGHLKIRTGNSLQYKGKTPCCCLFFFAFLRGFVNASL